MWWLCYINCITTLFVCLSHYLKQNNEEENGSHLLPTTPHQNYSLHKIKIYKKDNSSSKKVPTNIVTMYVVIHHLYGKLIWCITSRVTSTWNYNKTVEDTEPKTAHGASILGFCGICSFKFSHNMDMRKNFKDSVPKMVEMVGLKG